MAPSLPWIGAIPPCPPAKMQLGSLHSSASYGTSFGGHVRIRPAALTRRLPVSRAGCQARMGIVVAACVAAGSRTFALDSRASGPHLHHGAQGDPVGQYPGEEGSSPGPLPLRPCQTERRSLSIRERGGRSSGCLSGTLRRPPSSESHRRRPPLFSPRCHALYPVVPVTNLRAGARLHPRSVRPHRQDSLRIRSLSRPPRLAAGARVWRWGLRGDALGAGGSPRRPSRPFRPGTWITSGLRPRSDQCANFLASV